MLLNNHPKKGLLLALLLLLSSCALTRPPAAPANSALDSVLTAVGFAPRKVKIGGNLNLYLQTGQGNTVTAPDNRNAGRKGSAATAPGAVASTTRPAGAPAWVYALLGGLGLAVGFWLRGKLKFPLSF